MGGVVRYSLSGCQSSLTDGLIYTPGERAYDTCRIGMPPGESRGELRSTSFQERSGRDLVV